MPMQGTTQFTTARTRRHLTTPTESGTSHVAAFLFLDRNCSGEPMPHPRSVPTIRPTDELLDMPRVAAALGVSRPTAALWCWQGKLPAREIMGRLYVRKVDVDAFNAARRKSARRRSA
jgi:predicted DNA-binding transcriptional regulator AlpA